MDVQQSQQFNIRDYLTLFFKHKFKIVVTFLLVIAATGVFVLRTPQQYVAKAVVMVKFGREFVPVSEVGDTRPPSLNPDAIINTEMQILTGHELVMRVVNAIGPDQLYPDPSGNMVSPELRMEGVIFNFRKNLTVNAVKGSNLIEVGFSHQNPQIAGQAVNMLVEFLKDKHLQVFSDTKSSFLDAQLKEYADKLRNSESVLGGFKQRNQVFSLEEQKSLLIKDRAAIEGALKSEQIKVKELQQRIAFLKDRTDVFTDATVTELKSKLNTLEQKEQELTAKYSDTSQIMISHRKEMKIVKEQLQKHEEQAREQARNTEMVKLQAEVEPSQIKVAGLQKQYTEIDKELRQLDSRGREYDDLKRQAASNEANYQTYLKKSEEARISEDLDKRKMTNISVIEQAELSRVKSNRSKTLGIGLLLSIVLSLGLAYLAEFLPHCMTTPESAEKKLGLPVLVSIPKKATYDF
jgi:polysaccharide biosynthesis protein PslE